MDEVSHVTRILYNQDVRFVIGIITKYFKLCSQLYDTTALRGLNLGRLGP